MIQPLIEPQRIGRFLATDEQGYVRPDVARELIPAHWLPAVDFVAQALLETGQVESVYLRGSAPRGFAIDSVSDLDFVYLSESAMDRTEAALDARLKKEYPFIAGVEFLRLPHARLTRIAPPLNRPYFQMLLKMQSLFLAGRDITPGIAPFRPGKEMVSHVFELLWDFGQVREYLTASRTEGEVRELRQWFARRLVRSGLEVTMSRSGRFTRDLYLCYEEFARFYPGYAPGMYSALRNCLNGHEDCLAYGDLVVLLDAESACLR